MSDICHIYAFVTCHLLLIIMISIVMYAPTPSYYPTPPHALSGPSAGGPALTVRATPPTAPLRAARPERCGRPQRCGRRCTPPHSQSPLRKAHTHIIHTYIYIYIYIYIY